MKRTLTAILSLAMVASLFVACDQNAGGSAAGAGTGGYSIYTYLTSSKDATADKAGSVEVNSYIAYSAVGADGKIFKAGIDAAQSKVPFDTAGQIVEGTDLTATVKSKNELGDDYGMRKASPIGKEWNEQAQAFADWSIGKTLADVAGAKISAEDIFEEADLVSSVTVHASNFANTLGKSNEHKLAGTVPADAKMGLGIVTKISSSKAATADAAGLGQVDSSLAIVAIDPAGKITACAIEAIQSKVNFGADGVITSDVSQPVKTKTELGDDYGMRKASAIEKEWNEQAAAFAEWCVGKTVAEVTSMKTYAKDDNHPMVPDEADLKTSVTMNVGDYIAAVEKAAANAK